MKFKIGSCVWQNHIFTESVDIEYQIKEFKNRKEAEEWCRKNTNCGLMSGLTYWVVGEM